MARPPARATVTSGPRASWRLKVGTKLGRCRSRFMSSASRPISAMRPINRVRDTGPSFAQKDGSSRTWSALGTARDASPASVFEQRRVISGISSRTGLSAALSQRASSELVVPRSSAHMAWQDTPEYRGRDDRNRDRLDVDRLPRREGGEEAPHQRSVVGGGETTRARGLARVRLPHVGPRFDDLTQPGRRKLLLANATGDPVAGVRARNLEVLAARFRDSEEAHAAAQPGLDDRSAAVRFVAADVERGEKSMAVLRGIVVDARVEPQLRAEAFARLVDFYGYAKARDLVPAALEQPIRLLRRAA